MRHESAGILSFMAVAPPLPRLDGDRDHVVVLRNTSWEQYEALLAARGEATRPKLAYLDGELEIMTTSRRHELGKKLIARLLEMWAVETGVELIGAGETTFRREAKLAGLEPDECYFVDEHAEKEVPDIALEVVHTSGGVAKLEIYRRLGVREVWFWIDGHFWIYALDGEGYVELRASRLLPGFDLDEVARIVWTSDDKQTDVVRRYRDKLRAGR